MSGFTEKANRILTMIPLIRSCPGIRIEELARQLNVSPRTILSDLDTILMCGVPPYLPNDYVGVYVENGGVRIDFADQFKRPITLTTIEALGLRLALETVPPRAEEHTRRLMEKLERLLPAGVGEGVGKRFAVDVRGGPVEDRIREIERAVVERREVEVTYYTASRDAMTRRTLRPYAIVEHQGQWYVVAYCCMRERELPFRIDRIKRVHLTDTTFTVPHDFDIETYRRPEMYFPSKRDTEVVVRFRSPQAAEQTANSWSGVSFFSGDPILADARPTGDGALEATVRVSHPEWIAHWALQHGDRAEIVAPEALRRRVRSLCEELLAMYE